MIPQETLQLEQKAFIKGYQKLEILPDGDLEVSFKRISTQRRFRISMAQINSKFERHKFHHTGSLAGFLIFGTLTLFTLFGMITFLRSTSDRDIAVVLAFPFLFFVVFAWICFWRWKTQSVNATIFYIRDGGQIHVWYKNQTQKLLNPFAKLLARNVKQHGIIVHWIRPHKVSQVKSQH